MNQESQEIWWEKLPQVFSWTEELLKRVEDTLGWPEWNARNAFAVWLQRHVDNVLLDVLLDALRDQQNANRRNTALQVLVHAGRMLVPRVQWYLEDEDDDVRLFATQLSGSLLQPALIPLVKKRLEDANPNVRLAAVEALGSYGHAGVLAPLLNRLQHGDSWTQFQVVLALGRVGHPRGFHEAQAFRDHPLIGQAFVQSLGGYIDYEALLEAVSLISSDSSPRDGVQYTLEWFEPMLPVERLGPYIRTFRNWAETVPEETRSALTKVPWSSWMNSSNEELSRASLYWGALFQIPIVLDEIFKNLQIPHGYERYHRLIPWVSACDVQTWLRLWHAFEAPDIRHLLVQVHSEFLMNEAVSSAVQSTWSTLEPDTQLYVITKILQGHQHPESVLWRWVDLAWQQMSPILDDICFAWLKEVFHEDRRRASWWERIETWQHAQEPWKRAVALEIRSVLEPEAMGTFAEQAMHDPHPWVRYIVIRSIQRIPKDSNEYIPRLARAALTDEHPALREAGVLVYPLEEPDFISVMNSMLEDPEIWIRVAVVRRLVDKGSDEAFNLLKSLFNKTLDPPIKREILRNMGRFNKPGLLKWYREIYEHIDESLCGAAAEGVGYTLTNKDEAYETLQSWFDNLIPADHHHTGITILASMAHLNAKRFLAWFSEKIPRIEIQYPLHELLTILDNLPEGALPEWAIPWLFRKDQWPIWMKHLDHHPAWRTSLESHAPWRLLRLIELTDTLPSRDSS